MKAYSDYTHTAQCKIYFFLWSGKEFETLGIQIQIWLLYQRAFQVALVGKNPPTNAGDIKDAGSIPGSGRSSGRGNSNPFQYSCLGNPMDRRAWLATVHGIAKSQVRLKQLGPCIRD